MQTNYQNYLIAILFFLLSACSTTYGPVSDDNFEAIFLASVDGEQQILFYSRAIWYPNKDGFKFLPAGKKSRKGIIVCTDQGVYFSEWNVNGRYNTEFSVSYDQIEQVRHAANEVFGRLVVKNNTFNSFEILGDQQKPPYLPNKERTETAYKIIQQHTRS